MLTIAVIALLVFGPRRLPEIARKAGSVWRQLRDAAADMKAGFDAEFEDTLKPLADVRRQMSATVVDVEAQKPPPDRAVPPTPGADGPSTEPVEE